jgi:hypothetical protein
MLLDTADPNGAKVPEELAVKLTALPLPAPLEGKRSRCRSLRFGGNSSE